MPPEAAADRRREGPLKPIAQSDAVWLQDAPHNLMVINSVFTLDRIDLESLVELWQSRVLDADGGSRYPRFTWRVVMRGRKAYWQEDPDFDISHHIFVPRDSSRLDSKEKLQDYIGKLAAEPLPPDRPRWQLLLIPEFGQEGGSAVITRIHHCMGDGIGLVPILFSMMDTAPEGGLVLPAVIDRGGKPPNKFLLGLRAAILGPFLLLKKMLWKRDRNLFHEPELGGEKRVAWTDPIDLAEIKKIKNTLGATINDVLVACVAGGLRRYARDRGEDLHQLRVSMPINIRSRFEGLEMNNKFAAVLLPLGVDIADTRERIAATRRQMVELKRSIEPFFTYIIVNILLKTLPRAWSHALIDFLANKCSCVLTNVPGPQVPLYLAGRRLRAMLFWVPQRADIGIGISILTLAGTLRVGILADTALVPDPDALIEAFEEELWDLVATLPRG